MVETILTKIAEMLFEGLSGFAEGCLQVLGCNLDKFQEAFPIVGTLYAIIQGFSIGFVFLLVLWQAFKTFGLPLGVEVENPALVMFKGFLAIFCILFAKDIILDSIFPLFSPTYQTLLEANGDVTKLSFSDAMGNVDPKSLVADAITFTASSVVKLIGVTACMLILLINFLKLLLEVVERYILLGVLTYTSPLAFSTLPSLSTSSIFKGWTSMLFGQMVMLLLNVWTIKMFFSVMNSQMKHGDFFLWFFLALGFLKVAQRLDSYMQQIGINVGTTGNALGGAVIGLVASNLGGNALKGAAKGMMRGVSGAFGGAGGGMVSGAAAKAATGAGIGAMAAVGSSGVVGAAIKAQGGGLKSGLKGAAKAAMKSKWTNLGVASSMVAGVGATNAFKAASGKFASSKLGQHMSPGQGIDAKADPSGFIKHTKGQVTGSGTDANSPAATAFNGAFNGGENVPAFNNKDDISHVSVGDGQATVKGTFSNTEIGKDGKEKTTRKSAVYQFSRSDMYNQPSGAQGKDWSMCRDKSGNSYYVTKMKRDSVTNQKVMNSATRK